MTIPVPFLKVRFGAQGVGGTDANRFQDNVGSALGPLVDKLAQSTAWTTIHAFTNHWAPFDATGTTYNPPAYRVDMEGFCHLRGLIGDDGSGSAAVSSTLPVFQIPAALAPQRTNVFAVPTHDAMAFVAGEARIDAHGFVFITQGATVYASIDGITFQVGA